MHAVETAAVADIYVDGIDHVEVCGPNMRVTYYTIVDGGRIVAAKIVRPITSLNAGFAEMVRLAQAAAKGARIGAGALH